LKEHKLQESERRVLKKNIWA